MEPWDCSSTLLVKLGMVPRLSVKETGLHGFINFQNVVEFNSVDIDDFQHLVDLLRFIS